jgi:hypothetical protein
VARGRTTISFTSMSFGCSYWMARADGVRLDRHLAVGFHPFARGLVPDGVGKFRLDHAWVDAGTAVQRYSEFCSLLPQAFRDRSHRELGGRVDGDGRLNDEPAN